ncbi:MAG: hypothetical protein LBH66_06035 [Oscillospiraceae bacterium]|jgi:transcription antitermination factor NusG|nr:hypothetical protein [Oscillospiraceae bacterium]
MQQAFKLNLLTPRLTDKPAQSPASRAVLDPLDLYDPFDSLDLEELKSLDVKYHIEPGQEYVYCLHCVAWKQRYVASEAPKFFPCKAVNPILIKRLWKGKTYKDIVYSLMPGYIFLFSAEPMDSGRFSNLDGTLRVLQYAGGGYALSERDEQLARWLLKYDGTLGLSKAIRVGDRTRIVQGPLKDHAGTILEVNNHRRRAKLGIALNKAEWSVWMDFEFIDS